MSTVQGTACSLTHEAGEVEGHIALLLETVHPGLDPFVEDDGQDEADEVDQGADLSKNNRDTTMSTPNLTPLVLTPHRYILPSCVTAASFTPLLHTVPYPKPF